MGSFNLLVTFKRQEVDLDLFSSPELIFNQTIRINFELPNKVSVPKRWGHTHPVAVYSSSEIFQFKSSSLLWGYSKKMTGFKVLRFRLSIERDFPLLKKMNHQITEVKLLINVRKGTSSKFSIILGVSFMNWHIGRDRSWLWQSCMDSLRERARSRVSFLLSFFFFFSKCFGSLGFQKRQEENFPRAKGFLHGPVQSFLLC